MFSLLIVKKVLRFDIVEVAERTGRVGAGCNCAVRGLNCVDVPIDEIAVECVHHVAGGWVRVLANIAYSAVA